MLFENKKSERQIKGGMETSGANENQTNYNSRKGKLKFLNSII